MATDRNPAIDLLITQVDDLERKANAYKASVNVLCEREGLPPIYPDDGGGSPTRRDSKPGETPGQSPQSTHIRSDTFYGKAQQTAVRELLAIRKNSGAGPAKPSEILDALRAGGYQVEAKSDEIALVGLRAMLRKRTAIFHKLPNGAWGLREWYPNAKPARDTSDKGANTTGGAASPSQVDDDKDLEENTATPPKDEAAA